MKGPCCFMGTEGLGVSRDPAGHVLGRDDAKISVKTKQE